MTWLLAVHVVTGVLFVGPVAVTSSLFPRFVPIVDDDAYEGERSVAVAALLHRITRVYGAIALVVPVAGLLLAGMQGRLGETWITTAMVLTGVAGALLMLRIVPAQREALATPPVSIGLARMRMLVGVFNLLWVVVVVLMILRPGAQT